MACPQCIGIERQFNDKVALRELRRYHKSGPKKSTRVLLDELTRVGIQGQSLVDVGGGIGAIQHACAEEGASRITNVDASPAYAETARSEADRRGYSDRTAYLQGDFVELAPTIEPADFVTMDRVICCYHDMPTLLRSAAEKTQKCLGLVFPRENWLTRAGVGLLNLTRWLSRSEFRAYIHPHNAIEACAKELGLRLRFSAFSGIWRVVVFERTS